MSHAHQAGQLVSINDPSVLLADDGCESLTFVQALLRLQSRVFLGEGFDMLILGGIYLAAKRVGGFPECVGEGEVGMRWHVGLLVQHGFNKRD